MKDPIGEGSAHEPGSDDRGVDDDQETVDGHAPDPEPGHDGTVTWGELHGETAERLRRNGIERAEVEARWIIEETSGLIGSNLHLGFDTAATARGVTRLDQLVTRRLAGEPLQYVLGHWSFRSLDLLVDSRVLIPRPETEQVAEAGLDELDTLIASGVTTGSVDSACDISPEQSAEAVGVPTTRQALVADLGTGSGALALAIATERSGVDVWAVERDPDAAQVARANLAGVGRAGRRVRIVEGSWFEPLPQKMRGCLDLVVTNPPYVGAEETLPPDVADWEPVGALIGGPTGVEAIAEILTSSIEWLAPHGVIVVEIGETQGFAVQQIARSVGFTEVTVRRDYGERDRILVARRPRPGGGVATASGHGVFQVWGSAIEA